MKTGSECLPSERKPVSWYDPVVLRHSARRLLSSTEYGIDLDKRELIRGELKPIDLTNEVGPEGRFSFDFASDSGDGGNATYAVAYNLFKPNLQVIDKQTQSVSTNPGQMLFLGGDLCYPLSDRATFRYRFLEPFIAARHAGNQHPNPAHIAAIPQNHDWYDSVSEFCRFFGSDHKTMLGASTQQELTYFACALPKRWWVLGLDFALTGDIDRLQFDAFSKLIAPLNIAPTQPSNDSKPASDESPEGARIGPNDSVILIYPEPYWVQKMEHDCMPGLPKRYQVLEGLLGDRVRLRLAGDLHNYQRWARSESESSENKNAGKHLVICGTGGAFTHPTHTRKSPKYIKEITSTTLSNLTYHAGPRQARIVGRSSSKNNCETKPREGACYVRGDAAFPPRKGFFSESRLLSLQNLWALLKPGPVNLLHPGPKGSGGALTLSVLMGLLYAVIAMTAVGRLTPSHQAWSSVFHPETWIDLLNRRAAETGFLSDAFWVFSGGFSALVGLSLFGVFIVISREIADELQGNVVWRWLCVAVSALFHLCLHGLALLVTVKFVLFLRQGVCSDWPPLAIPVLFWCLSIIASGFAMGVFLTFIGLCGFMTNNAFSAIGHEGFKGFLRFELNKEGQLTAQFIGMRRVPTDWREMPLPKKDRAHNESRDNKSVRPYWEPITRESCWKFLEKSELGRNILLRMKPFISPLAPGQCEVVDTFDISRYKPYTPTTRKSVACEFLASG